MAGSRKTSSKFCHKENTLWNLNSNGLQSGLFTQLSGIIPWVANKIRTNRSLGQQNYKQPITKPLVELLKLDANLIKGEPYNHLAQKNKRWLYEARQNSLGQQN